MLIGLHFASVPYTQNGGVRRDWSLSVLGNLFQTTVFFRVPINKQITP